MRSLALIAPGPGWTDGRPVFDQDPRVLRDHLGHMRRLFDTGALLLGGPAYDGRSGVALLEAPTLEQAAALIEVDPAVARASAASRSGGSRRTSTLSTAPGAPDEPPRRSSQPRDRAACTAT